MQAIAYHFWKKKEHGRTKYKTHTYGLLFLRAYLSADENWRIWHKGARQNQNGRLVMCAYLQFLCRLTASHTVALNWSVSCEQIQKEVRYSRNI